MFMKQGVLEPHISEIASDVYREFFTCTGALPSLLSFAPGRVNLIGEYTDFNDGWVLPFAIPQGVYLAARPRTDSLIRLWSTRSGCDPVVFDLNEHAKDPTQSWSNYVRGVVEGFRAVGLAAQGFDAMIGADLPAGGGLSSSAALEVATAGVLESVSGRSLNPLEKALLCQKAEHDFADTPCGLMDQYTVIFGKKDHLVLLDCLARQHQWISCSSSGVSFLVINSMVKHSLGEGDYAARRRECTEAATALEVASLREVSMERLEREQSLLSPILYRRALHVISENSRTLTAVEAIRLHQWDLLGRLMYESHNSLRVDMEVSCAELDEIVRLAGEAEGVYGCRMTGGGFGGCCIALVEDQKAALVMEFLGRAYAHSTGLEPSLFLCRPAGGARLIPLSSRS